MDLLKAFAERWDEGVNTVIREALEQLGRTASNFPVEDGNYSAARAVVEDVINLVSFEPPSSKQQLIFEEFERYRRRVETQMLAYHAVRDILVDLQALPIEDPVISYLSEVAHVKSPSSFEIEGHAELTTIFGAYYYQRFVLSKAEYHLTTIDALRTFNRGYHAAMARSATAGLSSTEFISTTFPLGNVIENALYYCDDLTQREFCKAEILRSLAWCSSLMPHYKQWITNGADRFIQVQMDDARQLLQQAFPDLLELQSIYSSISRAPFNMMMVIAEHDPTIALPALA